MIPMNTKPAKPGGTFRWLARDTHRVHDTEVTADGTIWSFIGQRALTSHPVTKELRPGLAETSEQPDRALKGSQRRWTLCTRHSRASG
jgi:hypothetical protein